MSAADRHSSFNLEHLKKHAKQRLRACRAGDRAEIAAVQAALPRLRAMDAARVAGVIRLADLQQAIATERGFSNWADLARLGDPLSRLLAAVRGGHGRALRRDLPDFTGLALKSIHAAAALGDAGAVAAHLERDPTLATVDRDGWPPLMYVCGSPLARLSARHATSLVACVERLLDAGADPNATTADESVGAAPASSAFARAILSGNVQLSLLLHTRGGPDPVVALRQWLADHASPDSAILHRTFGEYFRRPDVHDAMRAEIAARAALGGAAPNPALALADPLELQQLRMPNLIGAKTDLWAAMLDRGYDPTAVNSGGRSALHGVVEYAPPAFLEVFLSRGIDVNVRDADGRSVIATAVRAGNLAAVDLLRAHGAEDDATAVDRLLGACLAGDADAAHRIAAERAGLTAALAREDAEVVVRAAGRGNADQVRLFIDVGVSADVRGESGATPLHQAAWRGQEAVVELLLERGASPESRDDLYGQTPREWAIHGSVHAQDARERCLRVAERLAQDYRGL